LDKIKKSNGKRNRTAGHSYERTIAKEFREIGYAHCKTSREASKLLDNCKVDHWGIPYNIQAKNGYTKGLNYLEILDNIKELLAKEYPQRLEYPTIIFHKRGVSQLAIMDKKEFYNLITKLAKYEGTETKHF
jgi:hypothetical protein